MYINRIFLIMKIYEEFLKNHQSHSLLLNVVSGFI